MTSQHGPCRKRRYSVTYIPVAAGACLLRFCPETLLVYPPISRPLHSNGSTRYSIINRVTAHCNLYTISYVICDKFEKIAIDSSYDKLLSYRNLKQMHNQMVIRFLFCYQRQYFSHLRNNDLIKDVRLCEILTLFIEVHFKISAIRNGDIFHGEEIESSMLLKGNIGCPENNPEFLWGHNHFFLWRYGPIWALTYLHETLRFTSVYLDIR
jgi:hypothetical protein